jgi:hypothetical protein
MPTEKFQGCQRNALLFIGFVFSPLQATFPWTKTVEYNALILSTRARKRNPTNTRKRALEDKNSKASSQRGYHCGQRTPMLVPVDAGFVQNGPPLGSLQLGNC